MNTTTHTLLSASTLIGDKVRNRQGEDLGKIEEIMLDWEHGRISYAVLSFGGFLGMGDKLFAIPWQSLELHPEEHGFVLDVDRERLENAPGFDKNNWPGTENADDLNDYRDRVYDYYGVDRYWTTTTPTGGSRRR